MQREHLNRRGRPEDQFHLILRRRPLQAEANGAPRRAEDEAVDAAHPVALHGLLVDGDEAVADGRIHHIRAHIRPFVQR